MLYPSLNQPIVFCFMIASGFLCAFVFFAVEICVTKLKKTAFIAQMLYFFAVLLCFFAFIAVNLQVNFGQFRFYTILTFIVSMISFRYFFKFLWTKLRGKWYNRKHGRKEETKKEKS